MATFEAVLTLDDTEIVVCQFEAESFDAATEQLRHRIQVRIPRAVGGAGRYRQDMNDARTGEFDHVVEAPG